MTPDTIYCGDSCELLETWPAGEVQLAFADPPYNIGYVYDKYDDNKSAGEFVAWCRRWMTGIHRVLRPDGAFYLAIGDDFAAELRIVARQIGFHPRNWIIWHYSFGQATKAMFARSHTHILYFVKDPKNFVFNDELLRFPSARHTEYQDLRANPDGRLPDDVWSDIPRVCGTFKERAGFHGCQLPEALLMRIIMASSCPGDIVLDPFVGSGTTAAAAKRLGRAYVGVDLSPDYVKQSQERLARVVDESEAKPTGGQWPALHSDMLAQLYRETRVVLHNLLPNRVALGVMAASLSRRSGASYSADDVAARLQQMKAALELPKLPNDKAFEAAQHVTTEGKRYKRNGTLQRKRTAESGPIDSLLKFG